MRRIAVLFILALFALAGCAETNGLPTVDVRVGDHVFTVEIAATPETRERGLMFRSELDPDHGMLFVFDDSRPRSFWMQNTEIPLTIAYVDRDGVILEVYDMTPFSTDPVPSRFPARYALEVNQGRLRELGIAPGDRLDLSVLPGRMR